MSGRGTITSRTTASPKSMIEWMKARSVCSMTSSAWATSAMASSSDSVTLPCASSSPLPRPMTRLARPMSTEDTARTRGKATRAETMGALKRAARSGLCTAQFLGTASKRTKITTTSKTTPTTTPSAPSQAEASTPTRVAETSWQTSTSRRTGLRNCSGSSTRLHS